MGKPTAAAVPIACCNLTLQKERNGTVSSPPPIATKLEIIPMMLPAPSMPALPGSFRLGLGVIPEQHLRGGIINEHNKNNAEELAGKHACQRGATQCADDNSRSNIFHDLPVHGAMSVMGAQAGSGRKYDRRHGGAQGEVQDAVGRKMLGGENEGEYRDQDQAATDTQQSGKEAHNRTQQQVNWPPLHVKLRSAVPPGNGSSALQNSRNEVPLCRVHRRDGQAAALLQDTHAGQFGISPQFLDANQARLLDEPHVHIEPARILRRRLRIEIFTAGIELSGIGVGELANLGNSRNSRLFATRVIKENLIAARIWSRMKLRA